jgi:hypothetical protein
MCWERHLAEEPPEAEQAEPVVDLPLRVADPPLPGLDGTCGVGAVDAVDGLAFEAERQLHLLDVVSSEVRVHERELAAHRGSSFGSSPLDSYAQPERGIKRVGSSFAAEPVGVPVEPF